jgi:cyclohexa-1,5-dienecarbonyl-CoA hydratase
LRAPHDLFLSASDSLPCGKSQNTRWIPPHKRKPAQEKAGYSNAVGSLSVSSNPGFDAYRLIAHAPHHSSQLRHFAVLASGLAFCGALFMQPGQEISGSRKMIEPVNIEEYSSQPAKRTPDKFQYVKLRFDGGVARMTLNRPDHNLLNEAMLREMADGISYAGERDDVKLIVLDSACKVFCGGVDIGEYTSQRVFQMLDAFHATFAGMLELGKPVVCVVNGPAIGGGAELAAFGDLVIATPKARFAQPEISIGVFPPLASTILPFLVGPKIALELVLTGEPVTAERALELGMVNRLVPEAQLEKTVNDLVNRINSHSGPVLTMAKKAILGGMGLSLRDGLKHSMNIFLNELYRLEDSQEGLRALVEKRKPNWKNR